jgi:hypothetical protein
MSRYDLTDFEWRVIKPLPPNKPRGVPRGDDRCVLIGISANSERFRIRFVARVTAVGLDPSRAQLNLTRRSFPETTRHHGCGIR